MRGEVMFSNPPGVSTVGVKFGMARCETEK